jgi:ABC-type glycerol-3-phosphate transport system substrate-binding protein
MEFYNNYGLPKDFNFNNRFRTGEMPIGIADYTTYNLLSVAAPEITGLWQMRELPGFEQKDGTISNVAPAGGSGAIIMQASKHKDESWEFLKWWTSENAQYNFGKELEAVMGVGARYNTANIDALQKLPWSVNDRKELLAQAENSQGTPEVPGGYYTNRNLEFAMWTVLSDKTDPREALLSYTDEINGELKAKRLEFGLK